MNTTDKEPPGAGTPREYLDEVRKNLEAASKAVKECIEHARKVRVCDCESDRCED